MGELQAGQGATGVRVAAPVTGADLRLWGWAAISRGVRAISYYAWYPMSSGYESNGYGLIELDGTVTERAKIAGEFAGVIARNAALFAPMRPRPSRVAILYNRLSYMVGGNTVGPGTLVRNSMLGIYRALFEQNIQADFIHPDEVAGGLASKYDVVYLSYPLMLQQAVADALKAYVRGGGTLISEARPAWNNERGHANTRIPGAGLDEVFGAREKALRSPEAVTFTGEKDLDGPLAPLAGRTFNGVAFAEHLEVTGQSTRVLARFPAAGSAPGDPAIVMSTYGTGRAILIGSFPSAAFEQQPETMRANGELLQRLVASAGRRSRDPHRRRRGPRRGALPRVGRRDAARRHQSRGHAAESDLRVRPRRAGGDLAEHGERRRGELRAVSGRSDVRACVRPARRDGARQGQAAAVEFK